MKNYKKLALGAATALLAATVLATPVLAEVGTPVNNGMTEIVPISATLTPDTARNYMEYSGKVTAMEKQKEGGYRIAIGEADQGVVLYTQSLNFILDQKTGKLATFADITVGMTVTAFVNANSPMTLSLPPQTSGAVGMIINADAGSHDLDFYNAELTNESNTLKINSTEGTTLISANGNKKALSKEDLKGAELLVLYTVSTKSIPAQTTPQTVIVMTSAADVAKAEEKTTTETMLPLRSNVESKGYKITWNGMGKPFTIANATYIYTIEIGKTAYTKDLVTPTATAKQETLQFKTAPQLANNTTTVVESSFIDALSK